VPTPPATCLHGYAHAVDSRQFKVAFQVALLCRAQALVKQNLLDASLSCQLLDLIGLAAANEQGSIRRSALAGHTNDRLKPSRLSQQTQLVELVVKSGNS